MVRSASEKIIPRDNLANVAARHHAAHQAVVFTNGCFDLLHIGHVRYLAEAREHGDVLFVGLNSDESVRRLKGPLRPLIPEHERAEMLAHLEAVDYVTVFSETTADELIRIVRPAIYVKGGDIDPARVPELPTVLAVGGRIVVAQYVAEHSTSDIISRVLNAYERHDA
jgi:rfaE bifunctional protein nucleotidyltransferase chain/domain